MRYTDLQHTTAAHNEWLKKLDFYKEEFDILTKRLNEVARKNTSKEVLIPVGHFENQFTIQRQNISDLQHRIRANLRACSADIHQHAGKINAVTADEIGSIEQDVTVFENTMKALRKDFNIFLSRWM